MNWQAALRDYAVTDGNMLTINQDVDKAVFSEIKRALQVFRAKWIGGKTQAFKLALNASQCLEFLLSVSSMPKINPHSYHPTPAPIKHWVFEESCANPYMWFHLDRPIDILEPSAGEGSLCDSIKEEFDKAGKADSQLSAMELLINSDFILPDSFKAPKCTAGIYWFSKIIQSANGDLYYDHLHGQCGKLFLTMRLHSLS